MLKKYFSIVLFLTALDQISKSLIVSHYNFEERVSLYKNFHFFLVYNENTVMGRFHDPFGVGELFKFGYLLMFALLTLGCIWTLLKIEKAPSKEIKTTTLWGLSCISAAGLGNALDRFFRPEGVVDFMHFSNIDLVFNFADIFAYMGIILSLCMALYIFVNYKKYSHVKLF